MRPRAAAAAAVALLLAATVGGCTSSSGSTAELCRATSGGAFTEVFRQGFDPTDTARAVAQLKTAAIDLEQLHDAAPSAVRGDVSDELAYVDAVTKVLQRVNPDDEGAVVTRINALTKERAAAQAASTKLAAYQAAHCTTTSTGS